jgi:acetoin utilization protein AcuB
MLIKDRMTTKIITVTPETDVEESYNLMKKHGIRRLPVVDSQGTLIGIVTDRDIRQVLIPWKSSKKDKEFYYLAGEVPIRDVMTEDVITIRPHTDVADAARIIYQQKIGGLPVVDENKKVVGIITEMDILEMFIEIMGIIGASNRIDVVLGDDPKAFEQVSKIVRDQGGEIISVGMSTEEEKAEKVYFFRLEPCNTTPIMEALKEEGFNVVAST